MPTGLILVPTHFEYFVEDVLWGRKEVDRTLPIVVYFDIISAFGDSQEYVLANTIEDINRLITAELLVNL